jgi:hypothetical protein
MAYYNYLVLVGVPAHVHSWYIDTHLMLSLKEGEKEKGWGCWAMAIVVRGTPTFAAATAFRPFTHFPPPVPTPAAAAAPDFPAVRKPQSLTPISAHL